MAQVIAETDKIAFGPPGWMRDCYRKHKNDTGGSTPSPMTNQAIRESGAGFWADMVKQGGTVVS